MEEKRNGHEDKNRQDASEQQKNERFVQERQKRMEQAADEHRTDAEAGHDERQNAENGQELTLQTVSDFHSRTNITERAGSAVLQAQRAAASGVDTSEDEALSGAKKVGEAAVTAGAVLSHSGLNAAYIQSRREAHTVADVTDTLDKALAEGKVTQSMLEGDRRSVIRNLQETGISTPMAKKIARNLDEIQDKILVRNAVLEFAQKNQKGGDGKAPGGSAGQGGKLTADDMEFVKSKAFFDPVSFEKHYGRIAAAYLRETGNPFFEKVNPVKLSEEDIEKRLRLDKMAAKLKEKELKAKQAEENASGGGSGASGKKEGQGDKGNRKDNSRENSKKDGGKEKRVVRSKAKERLLHERQLTRVEQAYLRELQRQKKGIRIVNRGKAHHGIHRLRDAANLGARYLRRADDPSMEGANQLAQMYRGGRGILRVGGGVYRIGKKTTGFMLSGTVRLAHSRPAQYVGHKLREVGNVAASAARRTRPAKALVRAGQRGKAAAEGAKQAVRGMERAAAARIVGSSKTAESLKFIAEKAKEKAKGAGKTVKRVSGNAYRKSRRAARSAKGIFGRMGMAIRKPIDCVLMPFHLLAQIYQKLIDFILHKVLFPLAVALGVIILLYILLIAMFSYLYGIGKTAGEAGQNLLGIRKESDVAEWVVFLNEKSESAYQDALKMAKDSPVSGTVYDGVKLYAYGSPKSESDETAGYYHKGETIDKTKLNGWHITYLDSSGNVIGNNLANTKDIISLVAVMMGNSLEDSSEVKDFLGDMWEGMHPILTLRESDIYHTEYSTDTFPFDGSDYYCTDGDFYTHYASATAEGVKMYDDAVTSHLTDASDTGYICTGSGCEYDEWDEWVLTCTTTEHTHSDACRTSVHTKENCEDGDDCTDEDHFEDQDCDTAEHSHSRDGGCYRHDFHRDYYCPGHAALHCSYGYRDVNVFVTLLGKEDFFQSQINSQKAVMTYKKPLDYQRDQVLGSQVSAFEDCTATVQFKTHFDGYKKRMKDFVNGGYWDYGTHRLHAVYNPHNGFLECTLNRLGDAYTLENRETDPDDKCIGAIEWVNRIYDADWFDIYGVALDNYDSGLAVGGTLNADDLARIQDAISQNYGDVCSARQALIDTALSQVGIIRYYWGGKPINAGTPLRVSLNGAGTATAGSPCAADYRGRAVAGLDCSGFVGWAYWTAFGIQPGCSTSNFTASLGLSQISFSEMQPGDIGLQAVPGASSNHIGIFLGIDENGKALWVHCFGSGGVVVNNTNCFRYYYRLM